MGFKKSIFTLNTFVNIKILLNNIPYIIFIFLSTPIKMLITPRLITFALLIFHSQGSLQIKAFACDAMTKNAAAITCKNENKSSIVKFFFFSSQ